MIHVVAGAGPVGYTVASQLAEAGHEVRVLTRSGSGPEHGNVQRIRADVCVAGELDEAMDGAVAVYHCIHGSTYAAKAWRAELPSAEQRVLSAAGRAGAVAVFPESLYSYGPVSTPITLDSPRRAGTGKLGVRTALLNARAASEAPTVSVAASDFYGPRVLTSHAGDRVMPAVLAGKSIKVIGSLDTPHSFTYVPDLAAAMIRAAQDASLWNSVLHAPTAPAVTQRQLITAVAQVAGVAVPKLGVIPLSLLRALGLAWPMMRELAEVGYQFTDPFVLDSAASEHDLGLSPTPLLVGLAETVRWWRGARATASSNHSG